MAVSRVIVAACTGGSAALTRKVSFMSVTVTLIGKPGCHLCDDAQVIIDEVIADEPGVTLEKVSLDDNPLWADLYGDLIPVVLIDGVEHAHWRLDKERFQSAVSECLTAEVD